MPRAPGSPFCPAAAPQRSATTCRRCSPPPAPSLFADPAPPARARNSSSSSSPSLPTLNPSQRKMLAGLVKHHGDGLPVQLVDDVLLAPPCCMPAPGRGWPAELPPSKPLLSETLSSLSTYRVSDRLPMKLPAVWSKSRTSPWAETLIAGKMVVPELIQSDFTAANIVRQIEPLLPDGPLRESMMKELARFRGLLTPGESGLGDGAGNRHKPCRRHHNQTDRQCLTRLRIRTILRLLAAEK